MASQALKENIVRLEAQQDAPQKAADVTTNGRHLRLPSRRASVVAAAIGLGIAGVLWINARASSQTTDDAYVQADSTSVAPKVRGLVRAIMIRDNQRVQAGDPLLFIDAEEFDAKVNAARAELADARADVAAAEAAFVTHDAEKRLSAAHVTEARTAIRSADAEASRADAEARRTDALAKDGFASKQTRETATAAAVNAEQIAARARASLAVTLEDASLTSAKRNSLTAALEKAKARELAAEAALDLAIQDQQHALIRAPVNGLVGNRHVRVGDYVQPGSELMSIVPVQSAYVTANFKETQTRGMRVGQPVAVKLDALGETLNGHVESFAPGSGSTFALLPFEPGTGNFTKIVQRVPVRIRFEPNQKGLDDLRAGLSATVTVRLRGKDRG